jgi:hypothetical protein
VGAVKKSPIALVAAAVLFGAWITYLGVQAARKANPVVVSRAQLLAAQYDIEADLDLQAAPATVKVRSVLYAADGAPPLPEEITIVNFAEVDGYTGPGAYLLPLVRNPKQGYDVARIGLDPGFPMDRPPPRMYPLSAEVRLQQQQARGR